MKLNVILEAGESIIIKALKVDISDAPTPPTAEQIWQFIEQQEVITIEDFKVENGIIYFIPAFGGEPVVGDNVRRLQAQLATDFYNWYDSNVLDPRTFAEGANHMGEREFTSYSGWRAAIKKMYPNATFEGDKDIANAKADGKGVGEWDGAVGCVYKVKVTEDTEVTKLDEAGGGAGKVRGDHTKPSRDAWKDDIENRMTGKDKPTVKIGPGEYMDPVTKTIRDRATKKVIRKYDESVEHLEELSKGTVASYTKSAEKDLDAIYDRLEGGRRSSKDVITDIKRVNKRSAGLRRADKRLVKESKEELEVRLAQLEKELAELNVTPGNQKEADALDDLRDEISDVKAKLKEDVNVGKFKSAIGSFAYKQKLVDRE